MDYLHLVSMEAGNSAQRFLTNSLHSSHSHSSGDVAEQTRSQDRKTVADYSELAMRAAKRMRRSKQKEKTGHTVCRHLLDMISETEEQQPAPRTVRHLRGVKYPLNSATASGFMNRAVAQYGFHANPDKQEDASGFSSTNLSSANDRQFSLTF